MRICSFLPSATEIVFALGLGDSLYGVSHECDYPAAATSKPRVVRSKFDSDHLTSQEIDKLVSEMFARGERIYEVDVDMLKQAKPDLVITQELCEVCAISFEDVESAMSHLDTPPQIVSLDPHDMGDMLRDIERVGQFTGTTERAEELVAQLTNKIQDVRSKTLQAEYRPRVACVEWLDPLMVAGHWVPEMVHMAGGADGMAQPGDSTRRIEIDELVAYAPEVLILMPCGMDVPRAIEEFSLIDNFPQWKTLPAAQNGRVYATDAGGLFSRSGPRLVDGVELMAQIIHPEMFTGTLPEDVAVRLDSPPVSA
jgi:iron complex transport system substrate-binding protein